MALSLCVAGHLKSRHACLSGASALCVALLTACGSAWASDAASQLRLLHDETQRRLNKAPSPASEPLTETARRSTEAARTSGCAMG